MFPYTCWHTGSFWSGVDSIDLVSILLSPVFRVSIFINRLETGSPSGNDFHLPRELYLSVPLLIPTRSNDRSASVHGDLSTTLVHTCMLCLQYSSCQKSSISSRQSVPSRLAIQTALKIMYISVSVVSSATCTDGASGSPFCSCRRFRNPTRNLEKDCCKQFSGQLTVQYRPISSTIASCTCWAT